MHILLLLLLSYYYYFAIVIESPTRPELIPTRSRRPDPNQKKGPASAGPWILYIRARFNELKTELVFY